MLVLFAAGFALIVTPFSALAQETLKKIDLGSATKPATGSITHFAVHPLGLAGGDERGLSRAAKTLESNHHGPLLPVIPAPGFYPADLSYNVFGLTSPPPTVQSAEQHGVYLNCSPDCWGKPYKFLNNLNESGMTHITDQYVGAYRDGRYPPGAGLSATGTVPPILYDSDMIDIAYEAASLLGSGYGHIYHIYLPPGQDVCFAPGLPCYSPDNPSTFAFCAYHSSFDSPIGHVLYTVEPYANVAGCQVFPPSPNGPTVDSTANILSHEVFETITDPDGTAWLNGYSQALFLDEIGDECSALGFTSTSAYFAYGAISLNGQKYEIQPEYSNLLHGCGYSWAAFGW